jgi:hypothetical protein
MYVAGTFRTCPDCRERLPFELFCAVKDCRLELGNIGDRRSSFAIATPHLVDFAAFTPAFGCCPWLPKMPSYSGFLAL